MRLLSVPALTLALVSLVVADQPKLNVLFLMSDDMRPELGCYGTPMIQTPNLDALAKAGVRFERAYCQYPLCNPSRTSLLTGRHPTETGVFSNVQWFGAVHPDWVTLPKHFKQNGYISLRVGKIFHGGIDDFEAWTEGGQKRRFEGAVNTRPPRTRQIQLNSDRIIAIEGDGGDHAENQIAERTIEMLRQYKDKPFFLACGFQRPHSPLTAPKKFFDLYDVSKIPLPPDFQTKPTVPPGFPALSVPPTSGDLFINREATPEKAREMKRAYWASVSWVDSNVGRVIAEVDKLGLREKTVIVFWGDHGYHLGEKGKWAKHGSLFEVGTRVPLIVTAPAAKGNGKPSPRIVQSLDLYPTLCDLCGLQTPGGLAGASLKPLLDDPTAPWARPAYTVVGANPKRFGVSVRTEKYRYAEWNGDAMLFDETADPHEMKNLAGDSEYAKVKEELSALVKKHSAR